MKLFPKDIEDENRDSKNFHNKRAGYTGFEPVISAVTGQRHEPLD